MASIRGIDNEGRGLEIGQLAPDFEMQYPDGRKVKLSDFKGKPVIVNFWATWCAPCEAELPEFVQTYEKYKDQGLVILGVNAQEFGEDANKFVEKYNLSFPVTLDSRGEVMGLYGVRGLPTTLFIDPEGRVARTLGRHIDQADDRGIPGSDIAWVISQRIETTNGGEAFLSFRHSLSHSL